MEKSFLGNLQWRFATKQFDPSQKVSEADMATVRNAIRFAPASSGLQAYTIYEIVDPAVRAELREISYGQPQVTEASHFLVFCGRSDLQAQGELMMQYISEGDAAKRAALAPLESLVMGTAAARSSDATTALAWSARQAYIALGFGLAACAELGLDSCPMEGFDPTAAATILKLPDHIRPLAYLAIGYRAAGPAHPKFRVPESELFVTV